MLLRSHVVAESFGSVFLCSDVLATSLAGTQGNGHCHWSAEWFDLGERGHLDLYRKGKRVELKLRFPRRVVFIIHSQSPVSVPRVRGS